MRAAALLGQELAKRELRLRPVLTRAGFFTDYSHFRNSHRETMERDPLFAAWQERLLELAEREGRQLRLSMNDSMQAWDTWYNRIVQPMKTQMWLAWEAWHDLPALYQQVKRQLPLHATQPATSPDNADRPVPIRVAAMVPSDAKTMAPAPTARPAPAGSIPAPSPGTQAPASGSKGFGGGDIRITGDGPTWRTR